MQFPLVPKQSIPRHGHPTLHVVTPNPRHCDVNFAPQNCTSHSSAKTLITRLFRRHSRNFIKELLPRFGSFHFNIVQGAPSGGVKLVHRLVGGWRTRSMLYVLFRRFLIQLIIRAMKNFHLPLTIHNTTTFSLFVSVAAYYRQNFKNCVFYVSYLTNDQPL